MKNNLTKLQQKLKRRKTLDNRMSHKPTKSFRREDGKLIPISERCTNPNCNSRTKHHHLICDKCHDKIKRYKFN